MLKYVSTKIKITHHANAAKKKKHFNSFYHVYIEMKKINKFNVNIILI